MKYYTVFIWIKMRKKTRKTFQIKNHWIIRVFQLPIQNTVETNVTINLINFNSFFVQNWKAITQKPVWKLTKLKKYINLIIFISNFRLHYNNCHFIFVISAAYLRMKYVIHICKIWKYVFLLFKNLKLIIPIIINVRFFHLIIN